MINTREAILIKGYPCYYIIDGKIFESRDATTTKEAVEREIIPNQNGKVALKNEKGTPIPMYFQQILDQVDQIKQSEPTRIITKEQENPKSHLDKKLVDARITLRMNIADLLHRAKLPTTTFAQLQPLKEAYEIAEQKLRDFDIEHPEYYEPPKKKNKSRVNVIPPSQEQMEVKLILDSILNKIKSINEQKSILIEELTSRWGKDILKYI